MALMTVYLMAPQLGKLYSAMLILIQGLKTQDCTSMLKPQQPKNCFLGKMNTLQKGVAMNMYFVCRANRVLPQLMKMCRLGIQHNHRIFVHIPRCNLQQRKKKQQSPGQGKIYSFSRIFPLEVVCIDIQPSHPLSVVWNFHAFIPICISLSSSFIQIGFCSAPCKKKSIFQIFLFSQPSMLLFILEL